MPAKNSLRFKANKKLLKENENMREAVLSMETRNKKLTEENRQLKQAMSLAMSDPDGWCKRMAPARETTPYDTVPIGLIKAS